MTEEIDNDLLNTNRMLGGKCQELEIHIERLNKVIIQLNTNK